MNKKSLVVAAALLAGAAFADAGGDKQATQQSQQEKEQSQQMGTGGSGQSSQTSKTRDKQKSSASVAGDVIAVEQTTVYVRDQNGVAIPIAVAEEMTLFDGKPMKQGEDLSSKVKKGDKVSAQVENGEGSTGKPENRATSIDKQK